MFLSGSHRWQLTTWTSYARSIALVCWAAAVLMTGVMGWSAWSAFDTAAENVDRVVARHEAGIVVKVREIYSARR
ncbi:hypothetical protein [uncultured Maricaulis sp.]|uniref:hypothetical protein n=1 Tax=uncultured Maricaulis sp. TaxID=174710 RepID=UPI0026068D39|nr:hypothetical protein [uncultured Maricaulis sp.]